MQQASHSNSLAFFRLCSGTTMILRSELPGCLSLQSSMCSSCLPADAHEQQKTARSPRAAQPSHIQKPSACGWMRSHDVQEINGRCEPRTTSGASRV